MRSERKVSWWLGLCLLLGSGFFLASCATDPPAPAPPQPSVTAGTVPLATRTNIVSAAVATPMLAAIATATATPPPTATPTPLPSPTNTPTVAATATMSPALGPDAAGRLADGQRHQTNGDYAQAIRAFLAVLEDEPAADEARQAQVHLAESYLMAQEYLSATVVLEEFLADYPEDGRLPQVTLMAARAYHGAGLCAQAIPKYEESLRLEAVLADRVYEWIGDCHVTDGRHPEAIAAHRQAVKLAADRSSQARLREKTAEVLLLVPDYQAALAEYDAILAIAQLDDYRAKIEYLAGQVLFAMGDTAGAQARYRRVVDRYPQAQHAYLALIELVNAGVDVDEVQRGLIDYYAGGVYDGAYDAAVRAFTRYLEAEPAPSTRVDEALYYKALAQRALDEPTAALQTLELLIKDHAGSELLGRAWLDKGATLALMGRDEEAVATYRQLVDGYPSGEPARQALLRAARLREAEGALTEAGGLYKELQARFPADEDADVALWRAGLNALRSGDSGAAIEAWKALLASYPQSDYCPAALYWLGKVDSAPASGQPPAYWDQLAAQYPNDYYALRIQGMSAGGSPPGSAAVPMPSTPVITALLELPLWDPVQAEPDILAWLRDWTPVPAGTRLLGLPGDLAPSLEAAVARAQALAAIGLRREALSALDGVRAAAWSDPLLLAQLAFFFRDQGYHGLAARCALRLVGLWPDGTVHEAPAALQYLVYPLAYADLISAEASANNLDPLLLAALIRQESLFEPVALSSAGARGLGQVMPSTGEGIARNLGMHDFVMDDLDRPAVSVKFGAYYLAVQLKRFDNQTLVALAAYNGGPGNTLHWLGMAGDDLDLFVEVITASESRRYLQSVYEQVLFYQELYRPSAVAGQ